MTLLTKQEDNHLWKLIKTGDESAFKALFKKYYKVLVYKAYRFHADEHKAKDHVQEVFLGIWDKRETLEIHTSVNAFLNRAVINKTIDYVRAQRFDFDKEVFLEKRETEDDQKLEGEELRSLIHQTADNLPDRCRTVFFMSRFEDMSHKEIAQQLGISTKTVENQITKALKILRAAITPYLSDGTLLTLIFLLHYT